MWIFSEESFLICLSDQSVSTSGARDHKASREWHLKMEATSSSPNCKQCCHLPWQPAAFVLFWPMWDSLQLPPKCHRRLFQLRQRFSAPPDLRGSQQICHFERSQTCVHWGHAHEASDDSGHTQQSDELQQPAVWTAEECGSGYQDGCLALPQHSSPAEDGGPSDRAVSLRTVVQTLTGPNGILMKPSRAQPVSGKTEEQTGAIFV